VPRWSAPRPERTGSRPRLRAVARLVPPGSVVADVGTDCAVLPLLLLRANRVARCVATDRNPVALNEALGRCRRHVAAGRLELRLGPGLLPLRVVDRLDVLVLSGLGARTMLRILDDPRLSELGLRRLVVQPQTEPGLTRRFLLDRGFEIVDERMARERGRDYVAIAAEPASGRPATADDLELVLEAGPCLLDSGDPLVADHWRRELRRHERVLSRGASGSGGASAARRIRLARRVLERLSRRTRGAR